MAEIKTIETKKITVEVSADWGTFKKTYDDSSKSPDILKIRFTFDAIKNTFGNISFSTKRIGGWFGIASTKEFTSVQRLRVLRDALTEVLEEVDKLTE